MTFLQPFVSINWRTLNNLNVPCEQFLYCTFIESATMEGSLLCNFISGCSISFLIDLLSDATLIIVCITKMISNQFKRPGSLPIPFVLHHVSSFPWPPNS